MKADLIISKVLDIKTSGEIAGIWVAEPTYRYSIGRKGTDLLLKVNATLNMDFAAGGEIEYVCELVYRFLEFDLNRDYELLINIAHHSSRDLEDLFDREGLYKKSTTGLVIWEPLDFSLVKKLVDERL